MARRRRCEGSAPPVREGLVERFRVRLAARRVPPVVELPDGTVFVDPLPGRLRALESGEPVEVAGWELAPLVDLPRGGIFGRYRVEPDGTLVGVPRGRG